MVDPVPRATSVPWVQDPSLWLRNRGFVILEQSQPSLHDLVSLSHLSATWAGDMSHLLVSHMSPGLGGSMGNIQMPKTLVELRGQRWRSVPVCLNFPRSWNGLWDMRMGRRAPSFLCKEVQLLYHLWCPLVPDK